MSSRNKKRLRLTTMATIILAIVAFFMYFNNRHSTIKQGDSDFYVQDTASITKIFMVNKKDSTLLLERTNGPKWRLNKSYFVRRDIMETMLETLHKMRVRQPISNTAIDNVIKDLAASSVKVEVYQTTYRINLFNKIKLFPHEKLTKVFYVGYDTQDNQGTVMLKEDAERPYVLHIPGFRGALSIRFLVRTADWRDLTIVSENINNIYSIDVQVPQNPEEAYKFINNNDKTFSLMDAEGKKVPYRDSIKVLRYLNYFQGIHLSELFIHRKNVIDSLNKFEKPTHIITIEDMKGNKTGFKIFLKKNDEVPLVEEELGLMTEVEIKKFKEENVPLWDPNSVFVMYNDDKDVGLAEAWSMNKIMRSKTYFLSLTPEEEKTMNK